MSGRTGKQKALIIRYIIGTLLVTVFFVSIIFIYYTKLYEEKRTSMIKDGRMSAMQAAELLEKYLSTSIDSIKLSAYALDEMIKENKPDSEIQDYLIRQSTAIKTAVDENSTGIYGYINGRFVSGMGWTPPEGFEPTKRPWYIKPMSSPGEITILDPYLDIQTGNVMLALGKTLCDGVSVVSVDVSLERIQVITENAALLENADTAMILNENGIVIAHSDKGEIGKDYSSSDDTISSYVYTEIRRSGANYMEVNFNNKHYIVYTADLPNHWHSVSVMDATAELSQLDLLFVFTAAATFLIIVIILAIMLSSVKRRIISDQLNAQLTSLSDIYITLNEINFLTDTFSTIHTSNSEAAAMIGKHSKNPQEIIRNIMTKFSDPSTRHTILDFVDFTKLNHRLRYSNTITVEYMNQDRKWRRARFLVSERVSSGKIARSMFLVEDIDTEKRERDETLEAVRLMNEQISSVANIYFAMHDIDLKNNTLDEIKTKVQHVTDLIGGRTENAQEIMYAVMDQMAHESSKAAIREFIDLSTLNERLRNTNTITEEFLSTKEIWSRARFIVSERAPDGSIEHVLWLVEGIDKEKRRRDRLTHLSEHAIAANEAKTTFLSNVSHVIRTLIHTILGMNERVLRESSESKIKTYSENIRNSGTTLLGLVNDIIDISGIESGKTKMVTSDYDLSGTISELVNIVQTDTDSRGIGFALDIDSKTPKMLHGDETHLNQVLMNLLNNAVNSTEDGVVTLGVHYHDIPENNESIMLDVTIKCSGTSLSPDIIKQPGNNEDCAYDMQSLSVNVAEGFLKMMGSSLKTEIENGTGLVLSFSIEQKVVSREPIGDFEESYKNAIKKRSAYRRKFRAPKASILAADDIPVNLMLLSKLLESSEISTDTALSGSDAIKLAKKKKYDIIILDHIMPEKNGVETLREIRRDKNSPNCLTPAVCLTANVVSGAREQYIGEGFDDYLSKPLDTEHLDEVLLKYLPEEKVERLSPDK